MPSPKHRSRSLRKVFKKLPGGRLGVHYERKKPKMARCSICQEPLAGVPRELPYQLRKLPKTQRRPERLHGGKICGRCLKRMLIIQARSTP